jgi:hypothetical protein
MLTSERQLLDAAFSKLIKYRRGQWVRRGGALSQDFEISFQHRGLEILAGTDTARLLEDSLFVFTRHAKGSSFEHDPQADATGRKIPGFSALIRKPRLLDHLRRLLKLRTVWTDPRRPGWFHLDETLPVDLSRHLPSGLVEPMSAMAATEKLERLSVVLTTRMFRVLRRPLLWDFDEIDSFVSRCLELLLAALDLPSPTPVAVPRSELLFLAGLLEGPRKVRCGVCGEGLHSRKVTCAKCQTPHHRECWEYGGGCSVYGCGSERCR